MSATRTTPLSRTDLRRLDDAIDGFVPPNSLFSLPRNIALVYLLRQFEEAVALRVMSNLAADQLMNIGLSSAQKGLDHALDWIYMHCPPPVAHSRIRTAPSSFSNAAQLLEAGIEYAGIFYAMSMLWRNRAVAERTADGAIEVAYVNQLLKHMQVADEIISAATAPKTRPPDTEQKLDPEIEDLAARFDAAGVPEYHRLSPDLFRATAKHVDTWFRQAWEFEEDWNLGGYTVRELRSFWTVLKTIALLHGRRASSSRTQDERIEKSILIRKRDRVEREIARYADLDQSVVSAIFGDLLYQESLRVKGEGKKRPVLLSQPIFPLHEDIVALSPSCVIMANPERNIWDLISITRPSVHDTLSSLKEARWIVLLSHQLEGYGLLTRGPLRFEESGRPGDIDLLVLDTNNRFGIVFELKWLTTPARIRNVAATEAELGRAVRQARRGLNWLIENLANVAAATGVDRSILATYEFRAAVLSKNTLGSGWVHMTEVPIINERILNWILGDPHRARLNTLWRVGEEHSYLPKVPKHFVLTDASHQFGEVRFRLRQMSGVMKSAWTAADIDLSGLP